MSVPPSKEVMTEDARRIFRDLSPEDKARVIEAMVEQIVNGELERDQARALAWSYVNTVVLR